MGHMGHMETPPPCTPRQQFFAQPDQQLLLLLNIIARVVPLVALALLYTDAYAERRNAIVAFARLARTLTHLLDNSWQGYRPHRLCSYHKTMLISAQLIINPIMLPIMMPLPLYLHVPLELANAVVLVMSAVSRHGLCAQLYAQLNLAKQRQHVVGDAPMNTTAVGWLGGELASDWPVCISTADALDKVVGYQAV